MPGLETSLYSMSLPNDDKTPMEFVVHVLEAFFEMDHDTAVQRMFLLHCMDMAWVTLFKQMR